MPLFPESFKAVSLSPSSSPQTSFFALHHTAPANPGSKLLLLLHGFPQNHNLYHPFVAQLSKLGFLNEWDIIIPDLPGYVDPFTHSALQCFDSPSCRYGQSRKPASTDGSHSAHSKRAIAADCVALIDTIYSPDKEFYVAGHDRGARVAYRMAADSRRVKAACFMEIIPTRSVWARMKPEDGHKETFRNAHWIYLALPSPVPETLLSASSDIYFRGAFERMTGAGLKNSDGTLKYEAEALESWITQYRDPLVLQGSLEDYRAGASIDIEHDSDPNSVVHCPILVLTGAHLSNRVDVEGIWKAERLDAQKLTVLSVGDDHVGHFIPYEAAEDCATKLVTWLEGL